MLRFLFLLFSLLFFEIEPVSFCLIIFQLRSKAKFLGYINQNSIISCLKWSVLSGKTFCCLVKKAKISQDKNHYAAH